MAVQQQELCYLFHYRVGQIVEIGDMTNLRIAGVNMIMKRSNK